MEKLKKEVRLSEKHIDRQNKRLESMNKIKQDADTYKKLSKKADQGEVFIKNLRSEVENLRTKYEQLTLEHAKLNE